MERIQDKRNADMYDKMIDERRENIEKYNKEISEIVNLDKTIKNRKSTLKHSIDILDDIIKENTLSNSTLHMLIDKIIIKDMGYGLNVTVMIKGSMMSEEKLKQGEEMIILKSDHRKFNTFEQVKAS